MWREGKEEGQEKVNVVLGSIFRNSTSYLNTCFKQLAMLNDELVSRGHSFRMVFAEGDSVDTTRYELDKFAKGRDITIIDRSHGGPYWGSADIPERWESLAWVCNGVLEQIRIDDNAFIYVESDLVWDTSTMLTLLDDLQDKPAVSPLVLHADGWFWDGNGFRIDGQGFGVYPPYHHKYVENGFTQMGSVGSCCVMWSDIGRLCRFAGPINHWVAFCDAIYQKGFSVWLDSTQKIIHPIRK